MEVTRIADKKKRELEALVQRNLALRKATGRMFTILLTVSIYIFYTLYANIDVEDQIVENARLHVTDSIGLSFVPMNLEGSRAVVDSLIAGSYAQAIGEAADTVKYDMPVINMPVQMHLFYSLSLTAVLVLSFFFWRLFRASEESLSSVRRRSRREAFIAAKAYCWVYDLPLRRPRLRLAFQTLVITFPVLFFVAVGIVFQASVTFYTAGSWYLSVFTLGVPMLLVIAFRITVSRRTSGFGTAKAYNWPGGPPFMVG